MERDTESKLIATCGTFIWMNTWIKKRVGVPV